MAFLRSSSPFVHVAIFSFGRLNTSNYFLVASLDGSIGFVLPITEKTYRRLLMLQNALNVHIPHTAGLNPKAYRSVSRSPLHLAREKSTLPRRPATCDDIKLY